MDNYYHKEELMDEVCYLVKDGDTFALKLEAKDGSSESIFPASDESFKGLSHKEIFFCLWLRNKGYDKFKRDDVSNEDFAQFLCQIYKDGWMNY